jgi:hypothetical protein
LPRYRFVATWRDRVREYGNTECTILQDEEEARRFAARVNRELKQAGEHDDPGCAWWSKTHKDARCLRYPSEPFLSPVSTSFRSPRLRVHRQLQRVRSVIDRWRWSVRGVQASVSSDEIAFGIVKHYASVVRTIKANQMEIVSEPILHH